MLRIATEWRETRAAPLLVICNYCLYVCRFLRITLRRSTFLGPRFCTHPWFCTQPLVLSAVLYTLSTGPSGWKTGQNLAKIFHHSWNYLGISQVLKWSAFSQALYISPGSVHPSPWFCTPPRSCTCPDKSSVDDRRAHTVQNVSNVSSVSKTCRKRAQKAPNGWSDAGVEIKMLRGGPLLSAN